MRRSDKIIVGRENDLDLLLSDLKKDTKTIRLVIGESGIGKSSILDNFYLRIKERINLKQDNNDNTYFIGYYSKREALVSELKSEEYLLKVILSNLIENVKEFELQTEETRIILNRIGKALKKFAEEEGKQIAKDIVEDMLKKIGLEKSISYLEKFVNIFKDIKSSIINAEELLKQREQLLDIYSNIFKNISQEFSERRFILILSSKVNKE
jgi:hypothetical protein